MRVIKENEPIYPCLMRYIPESESGTNDFIVLFTKYKIGIVLYATTDYDVGYYSDDWQMSRFEPYKGKLIITN